MVVKKNNSLGKVIQVLKIFFLEKIIDFKYKEKRLFRAVNSAVECHPHTVEVTGSNPVPPTMQIQGVTDFDRDPFSVFVTIL